MTARRAEIERLTEALAALILEEEAEQEHAADTDGEPEAEFELLGESRIVHIGERVFTVTTAASPTSARLPAVADLRTYCVWSFPSGAAPSVVHGAGIYVGGGNLAFQYILAQGGVTDFAGSGIRLRRYPDQAAARAAWVIAAPRSTRNSLPSIPPVYIVEV